MPGASCELNAGLKETGTMIHLTSGAGPRKSETLIPQRSRGHEPAGLSARVRDRTWWATEAVRTGTDWRSLADAVLEVLVSVGIIRLEQSTFELACEQADREQLPRPSRSEAAMAAPPTTIEALMLSLRRGVGALAKPDVQRRLADLDESQLESICLRVQAFKAGIAPPWSAEDVDRLISAWGKLREQR
jgi:hypothetical protein